MSGLTKEKLPSRPLGPPLDLASQSGSRCAFNSLGSEGSKWAEGILLYLRTVLVRVKEAVKCQPRSAAYWK